MVFVSVLCWHHKKDQETYFAVLSHSFSSVRITDFLKTGKDLSVIRTGSVFCENLLFTGCLSLIR